MSTTSTTSTPAAPIPATEKVQLPPARKDARDGAADGTRGAAKGAGAEGAPRVKVAGFIWRFGAALVDLALLAPPLLGFWLAVRSHLPTGLAAGVDYVVDMILLGDDVVHAGIALMPVFAALWFGLWVALLGTTPGKALLGLKIIDKRGGKPTALQAAIRALACVPGLLALGAGFLWIIIDPKKRGLHDILAGTLVVRRNGPK